MEPITKNVRVKGVNVYYNDFEDGLPDDPVIHGLKTGVLYGENNFNFLNLFMEYEAPPRKKYIFDGGGHVGTFSVPCIRYGHNVIIVEGAEGNFECIRQTLEEMEKNDSIDYEVHNSILSDKKRNCEFSSTDGPFGMVVYDEDGALTTSTIDELCEGKEISAIKLDLEGGEIEAILGAKETIKKHQPPMLVEFNSHCLGLNNKSPQQLIETVESVDYLVYTAINNALVKISKEDKFPFCVVDCICMPKNKNYSARTLSQDAIQAIAENGFQRSNEDCKIYFRKEFGF